MSARPNEIPFYDLYGESFLNLSADFVHLEDIRSRSAELGWQISPHRHAKLLQVLCVYDNDWTVQLDGETLHLSGDWLVTIPPGVVHSFHFAPYTHGYVLSVNTDVINEISSAGEIAEFTRAVWTPRAIEFKDSAQTQRFSGYLKILAEEMKSRDVGAALSVNMLIKLLFVSIARQMHDGISQTSISGRDSKVLLGFRELIDTHFTDHFTVAEYAERLFISVSTLSRMCHQHLHITPKKLIHQKLINEAKRRLIYTRQSLDEIAATLGFKDTGYFCRFFKQAEGVTAGDFRRSSDL